ncbi:OpgC domain-containing protein [Ramlibacter sp. AN1015]|uniref:OpgC domain-containing protein n=1 Tax=Ramlibacter sp. AN1015 TaxID=3133428 RepID=UPI0030C5EC93
MDAPFVPRANASVWTYPDTGSARDLRIDFMRGFVFVLLFTAHFDFYSWMSLLAWERVGVVSSAETFIILAGVVTGSVYGKRLHAQGLSATTTKLFERAWTLYKLAFFVAASVSLLRLVPGLDLAALTSFRDPVTNTVYPLYPPVGDGFMSNLLHVLLLQSAPHQFQVVGLYVVLFLLTPAIFWALAQGRTPQLLLVSWAAWALNYFAVEAVPGTAELRVTGAQFEYAFPLLAWQLLFVHGVVAGFHRRRILRFFGTQFGNFIATACVFAAVGLALFSWNHPLDELPAWARLEWIAPDTFRAWYARWFLKYKLGPGRLLNNAVLLVAVYVVLTLAWRPIHRAFGWLFLPLGQESMYVFFVHIYLILVLSQCTFPVGEHVWLATAVHIGALLAAWWLVKKRILFRWIPH